MNNAKHTPGPLHLNGTYLPTGDGIGDGNNAYICTADGRQLAQMYRKHPQAQAYAPMLAAAPAMYDALQNLLEWAKGNRGVKEGNPYCKPEVRQALKVLASIQGKKDYLDADTASQAEGR